MKALRLISVELDFEGWEGRNPARHSPHRPALCFPDCFGSSQVHVQGLLLENGPQPLASGDAFWLAREVRAHRTAREKDFRLSTEIIVPLLPKTVRGNAVHYVGAFAEIGTRDLYFLPGFGCRWYKTRLTLSSSLFGTSSIAESIRTRNWALDRKKRSSKNI